MSDFSSSSDGSIKIHEEVLRFANDYAYLCGQSLEEMADFEPIDGNPACDRLRADLAQLLESRALVEVELKKLKDNQKQASSLLEKFGFS